MSDTAKHEGENKPSVTMGDVWRFGAKYWCRQKPSFAFAMGLMLIAVVADVIYPIFSGHLIDALAEGVEDRAAYMKPAFMALFGLGSMAILHHLARISSTYFWIGMTSRILPMIVNDAHHKVQRFSTDWHANSFAGTTVRKITRGKWGFEQFQSIVFVHLGPISVVLAGLTIGQIIHEPIVGLSFLAGLCIYISISICLAIKYVSPLNRDWVQCDSKLGGTLADSITCNAVVKTFGSEKREDEYLANQNRIWQRKTWKSLKSFVDVDFIQSMMLYAMLILLIGLAVWQWAIGKFSPGDVSYTMTTGFVVMGYVRNIGDHIRHLQRSLNDMEDIVLFDKTHLSIADKPEAKPLKVTAGEIQFEDVSFTYENQNEPTYDGFDLTIKPGERVGLVGHSGSGKSTFVKLIQRLYNLDRGHIRIDGQDIADVTLETLRQSISMVPQDPMLFHRSLIENIAYGNPEASREEVMEAARKAHADEFIDRMPEGYETMVGERGIKLSGGERQRVAIARAILSNKPILILDEATSSLDSISESLIQDAIENLTKGRTTIMIAHRLSTIKAVDRILVFEQGQIIEQGHHRDLVKKENGKYKALYDMQNFGT
ncbi:MAG: ABC transporter ATP-binding protein [Pseudomonadota bacterium]